MGLRLLRILLIIVMSLFIGIIPISAQGDEPPVDTDGNDNIVIDTEEAAETVVEVTESAARSISDLTADFLNRLLNVSQNQIVQLLMVVFGVVLLIAGWRIYDWIIIISGGIIGGTFALAAVGEAGTVIEIAAFLVGALIGGVLGYFVYYVAVFMIGAYIGIVFTSLIAQSLELLPVSPIILLLVALIGGVVMLGLSFELLVVLASLLGAQLIVIALGLTPALTWIGLLTLLGIVLQIGLTRRGGYKVRRRPSRKMLFN